MPPRRETVRERLLYEYAKLIADSAIAERTGLEPADRNGERYWSFAMATYKRLKTGQLTPSHAVKENKLMAKARNACAYCGDGDSLQ